jgi:hypothetical protein
MGLGGGYVWKNGPGSTLVCSSSIPNVLDIVSQVRRPNECLFGSGKPPGVGILEWGVYEPREGNGKLVFRATWVGGGRILTQQGGFQVSRRGLGRGAKGN